MTHRKTQVLIIGSGPSGIVSANYLNSCGIDVLVVEKSHFPRFSIGESLIPRCMDNFEEAGLLDALKKQDYQIKNGARFVRGEDIADFDFAHKYGSGWDWTWQVPRADFDNTLAQEAQRQGVDILFGAEVTSVTFKGTESQTEISFDDGRALTVDANFIVDSSGFGRVLAKQLKLEADPQIASHSSIFTHIEDVRRPKTALGTRITFEVIEQQVWFWYIPFSNGKTSIGFVGDHKWFQKFEGSKTQRLEAMMASSQHFYNQFKHLPYCFTPIQVENISKNVTKLYGDGYVLTGNSAEFLDPVFSSGVSFATESGLLAAKLILKTFKNEPVNWQQDYVDYIKKGVNVFSTYVKEWYSGNLQTIFFNKEKDDTIKRQLCAVLAGYVWDDTNPFVKKHERVVRNLAKIIA